MAIITANWRARMVEDGRITGDEGSAGGGCASQEGGEAEEGEGATAAAAAGADVGEGAAAERDDEGQREEAGVDAEPEAMDWTPAEGEGAQSVQQSQEKEVSENQQSEAASVAATVINARHESVASDEERASRATSEMTDAANRMAEAASNLRDIARLFGEEGGNAGIISAQPSSASNSAAASNTSTTANSPARDDEPKEKNRAKGASKTPAPGSQPGSPRRSHAPRRSVGGKSSTRGSSTPATIASSSSNDNTTPTPPPTTTLSYGETFRIAIDPAPFDTRIYSLLTPGAALRCERERYAEWWRRSFLSVKQEPPAGLPAANDVSFSSIPP